MRFNWDDFKAKYQNEQDARQGFASLCEILMARKYPEFTIKNSDEIKEKDNQVDRQLSKTCKVFLSKYFLDGVSNSRKGQIRKSLNDNLPYMKANKITDWYLMLPLEFTPEESNWWENWSVRIKQENGITPVVFLSGKIVDMISDLDFDFPGTESIPKRKAASGFEIAAPAQESAAMLDFVTDDLQQEKAAGPENQAAQSETIIEIPDGAQPETIEVSDGAVSETIEISDHAEPEPEPAGAVTAVADENDDDTIAIMASVSAPSAILAAAAAAISIDDEAPSGSESLPAGDNKPKRKSAVAEPALSQLPLTWSFKQKFEALEAEKLALPAEKGNNQRKVFDKRREDSNVKNYLNDFVFGDMSKFKGRELLKKAIIYVTNQQFSRGLYIYEYANAKQLIDEPALKSDYDKGVDEAKFNLTYKYHMINGDLLFAKRDYINAAENYQKAMDSICEWEERLNGTSTQETSVYSTRIIDNEAEVKYLEAKGESLLQVGEFDKAITNFSAALGLSPNHENLKKRLELSKYLSKSTYFDEPPLSWLNIFIAPFLYFKARKIDPNIRELEKAEKMRKRAIWGLVLIVAAILGLGLLIFWLVRVATGASASGGTQTEIMASSTPVAVRQSQGDYYMSKISPEKPHFIDSAINAYERALRYDNTDTAAEAGYQKALLEKENYIKMVQKNIATDSATYFLSMRRPTEGLRLFKYKYDPNDPEKGKFGYVDTLGNVKIAPVFDFNYRRMDSKGETFYNGRALVCLEVGNSDTIYFYIDQRGNKIEQ